jgi:hypothetical protein
MIHLDYKKQLKVSDFAQYWNSGATRGTITYTGGSVIGFDTHFNLGQPYLRLYYSCGDVSYDYMVRLESMPSNLGRGDIWYFVCPVSERKCRKLFFVNAVYVHRQAFPGQYYEQQADSKRWRGFTAIVPREEAAMKKLSVDTIRVMYDGKLTKRYIKLQKARKKFGERYGRLLIGLYNS